MNTCCIWVCCNCRYAIWNSLYASSHVCCHGHSGEILINVWPLRRTKTFTMWYSYMACLNMLIEYFTGILQWFPYHKIEMCDAQTNFPATMWLHFNRVSIHTMPNKGLYMCSANITQYCKNFPLNYNILV